jgi:hypothetical protein
MTKTKWSRIISGAFLALGLLSLSTLAAAAPYESQTTHGSMVVTGIDRTARTVTLQNSDGESKTIDVPAEVKAYDTLKVGDHIDVDYYESVAVSLLPAGSKPTVNESSSLNRTGTGTALGTRTRSVSATVTAVDIKNNKVTIKGPRGNSTTVSVSDPDVQKKLPSLKPGQVVQLTYTEAMAASIRPTSPASSKMTP